MSYEYSALLATSTNRCFTHVSFLRSCTRASSGGSHVSASLQSVVTAAVQDGVLRSRLSTRSMAVSAVMTACCTMVASPSE